jgi:MoxR-like ATPase
LEGRTAPIIEDIRAVAMPILRHRIILNHRAIGDNYTVSDLVQSLLRSVSVMAAAG